MKLYKKSSFWLVAIMSISIITGIASAQSQYDWAKIFCGKWVSKNIENGLRMELNIKRGKDGLRVKEITVNTRRSNQTNTVYYEYKVITDTSLMAKTENGSTTKMNFKFSSKFD